MTTVYQYRIWCSTDSKFEYIWATEEPTTLAHKKHGTLPWKTLVQPAVTLAEQGFVVPEKLALLIKGYIEHLNNKNIKVNFANYFASASSGKLFKLSSCIS